MIYEAKLLIILYLPQEIHHKNLVAETFRTQYTAYRTHLFRPFGAAKVVLIPRQSHVLHMWGVRPAIVGRASCS